METELEQLLHHQLRAQCDYRPSELNMTLQLQQKTEIIYKLVLNSNTSFQKYLSLTVMCLYVTTSGYQL